MSNSQNSKRKQRYKRTKKKIEVLLQKLDELLEDHEGEANSANFDCPSYNDTLQVVAKRLTELVDPVNEYFFENEQCCYGDHLVE